jgi:hypothetical protein
MDYDEDIDLGYNLNEEELLELSESYLDELFFDLTYDCVSENLLFIKSYTKEKGLPIAENLSFNDLFEYLFE